MPEERHTKCDDSHKARTGQPGAGSGNVLLLAGGTFGWVPGWSSEMNSGARVEGGVGAASEGWGRGLNSKRRVSSTQSPRFSTRNSSAESNSTQH